MTTIIVSSVIVSQSSPQADGRIWVNEQHTDCVGVVHAINYLAPVGSDLNATLSSDATNLGTQLTAGEIAANLSQVMNNGPAAALTFNYSTMVQSVAAMALNAANLTPWQMVLLGQFLASLPQEYLTAQVGLSGDQITGLQTAVSGVSSALSGLQTVVGQIATQDA